jgi:hypothetical protein
VTIPASGLRLIGYQDAITARIKALYPNFEVIEDTLTDDRIFDRDVNGVFEQYIVLRYGPMFPKIRGGALAGVRHDEYFSTFDILAVAANARDARYLCAAIVDDMLGWSPDGSAPITLRNDGGAINAFVVQSNEARPTRNLASQRMQFTVNSVDVGGSLRS